MDKLDIKLWTLASKGQIVPDNETAIRKIVAPEQKKAFKLLMGNRLWSWQDPENLKDIFGFLPK